MSIAVAHEAEVDRKKVRGDVASSQRLSAAIISQLLLTSSGSTDSLAGLKEELPEMWISTSLIGTWQQVQDYRLFSVSSDHIPQL